MSMWYLKKPDGAVYGPVSLEELKLWAQGNRIAADDLLSADQSTWIPAPELTELELHYTISFRQGGSYGPVHLQGLCQLILQGDISPEEPVTSVISPEPRSAAACCIAALQSAPSPSASTDEEKLEQLRAEHAVERDRLLAAKQQAEIKLAALKNEVAASGKRFAEEQNVTTELKSACARLQKQLEEAQRKLEQKPEKENQRPERDPDPESHHVLPLKSACARLQAECDALRTELEAAKRVRSNVPAVVPAAPDRARDNTVLQGALAQAKRQCAHTLPNPEQVVRRAALTRPVPPRPKKPLRRAQP